MPARHHVLAIIAFWLATTGWLIHREFWPRWRRGDAPPFSIDLAYEAQQAASTFTSWRVFRGDKQIGFIHTSVRYNSKDDTFEMHSGPFQAKTAPQLDLEIGPIHIRVTEMNGMYRINREGELREMTGQAIVTLEGPWKASFGVGGGGVVKEGQFIPYAYVETDGKKQDIPLEPVPFTSHDSILNPLQPVSRISGLRRGQHWTQHLVNPLAETMTAIAQKNPLLQIMLQKSSQVDVLMAEVLPETQTLVYEQKPTPCLVIEYRNGDFTAHTWVRESDGKVLKQEVTLWKESLVLERL